MGSPVIPPIVTTVAESPTAFIMLETLLPPIWFSPSLICPPVASFYHFRIEFGFVNYDVGAVSLEH